MKEILLTMKENNIYNIIKKLVETNGNKKRSALKINCTLRNINILINKYIKFGKEAFSHKNKNIKPKRTISDKIKQKILNLYSTKYYDYNITHFREKLIDLEGINISYTPLRKIIYDAGFISPLCFKRTKRQKKKELSIKKKLTEVDKKLIQDDHILDSEDSHPRRPRCKYFGELIQMDASGEIWFNNIFSTLHLAVDDNSGYVVGAYFDTQETLNGYYNVFKGILTNYGIPYSFLTDNRTVFNYLKKNSPKTEYDPLTQFGYACKSLGVHIDTSSIPQHTGRIERLNGTFQRRLPQEMRLANIKNIDQANDFLISYLKEFNKRFGLQIDYTTSVFEKKPTLETINQTLAIICTRVFDCGSSIKFKNAYYQAVNSSTSKVINFRKDTKCLVIKTFDNNIYISVEEKLYKALKIDKIQKVSQEFDEPQNIMKPSKIYVPPMNHPWKRQSFTNYLKTVKHHVQNGANV